jgi:DNA-binding LytR/AlgR family response regulator
MIKAVAIDDEPPALSVLNAFCDKVDFMELRKTFTNTEEALKYLSANTVDVIFLDVNMPAISGIDFYKRLPEKPMLILTTAYSEFAVEGFNINAIDYLLKPFTFARFMQSVEKAMSLHNLSKGIAREARQDYLVLRIDYSLMRIALNDILYIEGLDDYLKIHLRQQKPLVVRLTMKAILEKLPNETFIRVHRSYIVAMNKVESIRNKLIIINGEEIPISTSYATEFYARLNANG